MKKIVNIILCLVVLIALGAGLLKIQYRKPRRIDPQEILTLATQDLVEGEGAVAVAGKTVSVLYEGTFLDGKSFGARKDPERPLKFRLGSGAVIPGWDRGIVGMKVGGKRKLTVPASLAYGDNGASEEVPPNTPVVYEIELIDLE